jgi:hypothetical protein
MKDHLRITIGNANDNEQLLAQSGIFWVSDRI